MEFSDEMPSMLPMDRDSHGPEVSGARQKVEEWEADEGPIKFTNEEERERMRADPFYKLEHDALARERSKKAATVIEEMYDKNDRQWSDPYTMSQKLRKSFRTEKKRLAEVRKEKDAIKERHGLAIDVLDESKDDDRAARLVEFDDGSESRRERRMRKARSGSMFATRTARSQVPRGSSVHRTQRGKRRADPMLNGFNAPSSNKETSAGTCRATGSPGGSIKTTLVGYGSDDE